MIIHVMKSIDLQHLYFTQELNTQYERHEMPLIGFIYTPTIDHSSTTIVGNNSSMESSFLKLFYTTNIEIWNDLPTWAANSAIQSHIEKCMSKTIKAIEQIQVRKEHYMLPNQFIPMK